MKKLMMTVAASAFAAALPTTMATAAEIGVSVGASADASVSGGASGGAAAGGSGGASLASTGSASGSGSGSISGGVDLDKVLLALATTQAELDAIAAVGADTKVNVIGLDAVISADADVFAQAAAKSGADTAELQAAIEDNAGFKADLEAAGIAANSIVAANIGADGVLTLYTTG